MWCGAYGGAALLLEVTDCIADRLQLLGILIGNFNAELFLEGHDELDGIQRVRAEILYEQCFRRDLFGLHTQLVDDDFLHLCFGVVRHIPLKRYGCHMTMPPSTTSTCPVI